MRFKFRKVLERPDWTPPATVVLEIIYKAEPYSSRSCYDDDYEPTGGVSEWRWRVITLQAPGCKELEVPLHQAQARIECEPDIEEQIADYCREDFAEREPPPWPDEEI